MTTEKKYVRALKDRHINDNPARHRYITAGKVYEVTETGIFLDDDGIPLSLGAFGPGTFVDEVPAPSFKKDDAGKLPLDLLTGIPLGPLVEVAKAMDHGAKRYGRDNWTRGEKSRYLAAALRHVWSWANGEKADPDTGLHPLAHAVSNLLFVMGIEEGK